MCNNNGNLMSQIVLNISDGGNESSLSKFNDCSTFPISFVTEFPIYRNFHYLISYPLLVSRRYP